MLFVTILRPASLVLYEPYSFNVLQNNMVAMVAKEIWRVPPCIPVTNAVSHDIPKHGVSRVKSHEYLYP